MLKDHIHTKVKTALEKLYLPTDALVINKPGNETFGDYATSVALQLAKQEKKNPMDIAQQIADTIDVGDVIEKVEVMKPGFVNIWIGKQQLMRHLADIDNSFGNSSVNKDKKVIVEYSSPNIAKPFTIGHLRSTIIGDAIAQLLEATGATVYRDNHLGDWGTQFGKLIYAIKTWGNEDEIKNAENPVKILVDLYIKFHTESDKHPELDKEGRKWFKKLEEGDHEARRLWEQSIEWSWHEFDKLYKQLSIRTEKFENNGRGYGESYFEDKMQPVIDELKEKNIVKESKGAWLVFFPHDTLPPLMIMKQDGATLYSTRDLATDKFRREKYGSTIIIINEVGAEQALYFKQLYETEKLLGWFEEGQRIHIKHGMYRFKDSKMSTRKGNTIWLEDVLKEAESKARELNKDEKTSVNENVAIKVGIGALKWNDLKRSSHLDIIFDWDDILNMQGNSGPYIQYTYVRCKSVLNKSTNNHVIPSDVPAGRQAVEESLSLNDDELSLLRTLVKYPETVHSAAANFAPNYICTYLYDLAQKYNLFYQKHAILKADKEQEKQLRLRLTAGVAQVLKNGLGLLGIETVEKM